MTLDDTELFNSMFDIHMKLHAIKPHLPENEDVRNAWKGIYMALADFSLAMATLRLEQENAEQRSH